MKIRFVKIIAITVLTFMVSVQAKSQSLDNVYLYLTDGTPLSMALNDISKITFAEQAINLFPATGEVISLPYDFISVITFKAKETSVPEVKKSDLKLYLESDRVLIESDTEISAVKMYNLQGRLLVNQTLKSSFTASIPLSSYPTGVYIVQVFGQNSSVHKIIKK